MSRTAETGETRDPGDPGPAAGIDLTRRSLLRKGILGTVLLVVGGGVAVSVRRGRKGPAPREALRVFSEREHAVFAAMAERVIVSASPSPTEIDVAGRADRAMALALPSVQKEFKQLLGLFENGVAGALTGTGFAPFTSSSRKAQDARLEAWSRSRLPVLRTGYQAMKRLAVACYYSHPATWKAIGYSGPPEVNYVAT
jgi:hypothetical protein